MSNLVKPHGGGDLKPLLLAGAELEAERQRARSLPRVPARQVSARNGGGPSAASRADTAAICSGM